MRRMRNNNLAPVVQTSESAIHRTNLYPAEKLIGFPILIRCIVIYRVDSDIQPLNNRYLEIRIVGSSFRPQLLYGWFRKQAEKSALVDLVSEGRFHLEHFVRRQYDFSDVR